jgi:uncharacterized cupin superfamily protein
METATDAQGWPPDTEAHRLPNRVLDESHPVPNLGIRYRHLTLAAMGEDYRVGVAIEELDPGMRSNPAHYHFKEEEHVFVLEGAMTIRFGDEHFPVKAGGYCCFPAG